MSYEIPKLSFVRDNIVRVHHPDIIEPLTQLTASVAATGTALTVRNNAGFTNADLILYEGYGNANAELKALNAAVTAGTALTSTATTFAHAIDCPINKVLWNQIEISGATTTTGTKTVIATISMDVTQLDTDYVVTGTTYTYYFVRYVNGAVYSSYSDAIAATDFPPNTVGFVRRAAFENLDQPFEGKFHSQWLYDSLWQCEQDVLKQKRKWSCMVEQDYDLGDVTEGMASVALPTDIEDKQTNKAVLGVRIGNKENMEYVDNAEFSEIMLDVAHTTLASTAAVGATSLTLTDSNDFDDDGSVMIAGTEYAYTANNRTTNVLTGLTALTAEITAAVNIWQGIDEGEPTRYTVIDGYIYFDCPPDDTFADRNIWLDYYKGSQRYNSDGDELLMNDPGLYIYWIEMAIKKKKGNGELTLGDQSAREYEKRRTLFALQDKNPYGTRMVPQVPTCRPLGRR